MQKDKRQHQRNPASGNLRIKTSLTGIAYTVSLRDVSKGGAFIHTIHLPKLNETISFEILDEYGLQLTKGHGKVVRIVSRALETAVGFAIRFDEFLDPAMLDYLSAVRLEETA